MRWHLGVLAIVSVCLVASPAWAQSATTSRALSASAASPNAGYRGSNALPRRQVGAALRAMDTRQRFGIPARPGLARWLPPLNRLAALARGVFATREARARIDRLVRTSVARAAREGVTGLGRESFGPGANAYDSYLVERAVTLEQHARAPGQVTDAFVTTGGRIKGVAGPFPDRRLFVRRWSAVREDAAGRLHTLAEPDKVYVIVPGYQETTHSVQAMADMLSRAGNEVRVVEPPYAGYSDAPDARGLITRGFELTTQAAHIAALAGRDHPNREVVLVGDSMAGSMAVVGPLALGHAGRIDLPAGLALPAKLSGVAFTPTLRPAHSMAVWMLKLLARIPGLGNRPLRASASPTAYTGRSASAVFADSSTWFDTRGRPAAINDAATDEAAVLRVAQESGIGGKLTIVTTERDVLSDFATTSGLAKSLQASGHDVDLHVFPGSNHVTHNDPRGLGVLMGTTQPAR